MAINKWMLTLFLGFLAFDVVHLLPESGNGKSQNKENLGDPIQIEVSWSSHDYDLHTTPTIQVVVNPLLDRHYSPVHDQVFASLKNLQSDYTRYAAWFPYPKMSVAELDPPSGLFQCGNVGQDVSIDLSCEQSGGVISKIDFASYGTSSGPCGQMKQGSCHASNSSQVVTSLCLGKQKCSVPAAVDLFGDPCKFTLHMRLMYVSLFFIHCCNRFWNSKAIIDSNRMRSTTK